MRLKGSGALAGAGLDGEILAPTRAQAAVQIGPDIASAIVAGKGGLPERLAPGKGLGGKKRSAKQGAKRPGKCSVFPAAFFQGRLLLTVICAFILAARAAKNKSSRRLWGLREVSSL